MITKHLITKVIAAILFSVCADWAIAAEKPNIIVLLADDLGYADIGAQGISKDVRTPNIDSIAANGVRFTNGYVSCPVCSPTRAGFLTGRYQQRFGHEFNPGPNSENVFGLALDQITIAQQLKSAGYITGMVGKWHEGNQPQYYPTRRGFDEFYGFLGGAHGYMNLKPNGKNSIMRGETPIDEKEYLTDAFGREACAFIDRHHDKSFFLYMPFNAVHNPQEAPQKYLDRFPNEPTPIRKNMLAMLSAEDDAIGKILAKVREHKLEENTLIFFFSDNGGPTQGNGSRNAPLTGVKGEVWEGGIREPFMAQWKGRIPAGKVFDQPIISLDIFTTAMAVGGGEIPKDRVIDGVNILPLMEGKTFDAPHEALFWRFGKQAAVRQGDMKLVRFDQRPPQLYDLSKDIAEKHDLAAEKPDVVKTMKARLEAWESQLMTPRWSNKTKFEYQLDATSKQDLGNQKAAKKAKKNGAASQPAE